MMTGDNGTCLFTLYTWTLNCILPPADHSESRKVSWEQPGSRNLTMIRSSVFVEQSSVWCALGWVLKWNLTSLYHSLLTCARVLFPGPLSPCSRCVCPGWRWQGTRGCKEQSSRFDLESSLLFSSHPLSGPCGVQVSFPEAFHSCSYFRT